MTLADDIATVRDALPHPDGNEAAWSAIQRIEAAVAGPVEVTDRMVDRCDDRCTAMIPGTEPMPAGQYDPNRCVQKLGHEGTHYADFTWWSKAAVTGPGRDTAAIVAGVNRAQWGAVMGPVEITAGIDKAIRETAGWVEDQQMDNEGAVSVFEDEIVARFRAALSGDPE